VKEYLTSLVGTLTAIDSRNSYVLFHTGEQYFGSFQEVEDISLGCDNRLVFDWLKLPRALKKHGIDVAFFPSSNMPPGVPCKAVVTVHDLGYFYKNSRMYRPADTFYMKWAMAYTARRAERLVAISGYTKKDMMRILGVPEKRVSVIYEAADGMYRKPVDGDEMRRFRSRHGLVRPFFLYTGSISPRKNLKMLLEAFGSVRERVDADLVVTGGISWGEDWNARVNALGLAGRVARLGDVVREEMPLLYASALAYVFPSLFEGFGLPVLEAQAVGVPVICSNAASLPEVAGESAYFIDPHDVAGLARALVEVAEDGALREKLVAQGRANERRFSWEAAAAKTLEVFEEVHLGNF